MKEDPKTEIATFAAGCFWGVQESFDHMKGVVRTEVGYTGGTKSNPTYEEVCALRTGHAEAVRIEYDPAVVSYDMLLKMFWSIHDPTQVNRQGPDVGDQYRSVIFYHTPEQQRFAEASKRSKTYPRPIATKIIPAGAWYPAEEHHQHFLHKRGLNMCGSSYLAGH